MAFFAAAGMVFSVFFCCFIGRKIAKSTLPLCPGVILLFSTLGQTKVYELITEVE